MQKLDDTFADSLACAALIDQMEEAFRATGKLLIQVARTREEIQTTQAYAKAMGTDLAGVRQKICQNIGKIAAKVVRPAERRAAFGCGRRHADFHFAGAWL